MSGLPDVSDVIVDWFTDISFGIVLRANIKGDWKETISTIATSGVVQPYKPQINEILPEGTWACQYRSIHCQKDLTVNVNDYIIYNSKRYKVMEKLDFSLYGYYKYVVKEAFETTSGGSSS